MAKTFKYILDFEGQTDKLKKDIGGINGMLKTAVTAAAGLFAVDQVVNFGKESVAAYNNSIQAETALLTALKGRTDVQQHLIGQATELMDKTLFDDDETVRAQSLVAAFVKEEDKIKSLIPLIQDMATAKQMDLAGAADLVTKTLAGEMNALGRYGIKVEGAAGSAERLAMIQKGLNDAFGGQAEAAAKVGTAALVQLGNEYGNLQEVIGKLIISQQNQEGSFTKVLTSATKGISNFLGSVSTWSDAGFSFTDAMVAAFVSTDEETKKLAESMIVVKKTTDGAAGSGNAAAEASKYQAGSVGALGEELTRLNEKLATTNSTDIASIQIIGAKTFAINEQIAAIEKLKAAAAMMAEDTAKNATGGSFRTDHFNTITTISKAQVDSTGNKDQPFDTKATLNVDSILKNMPVFTAAQEEMRAQMAATEEMTKSVAGAFASGFEQIGQSIVDGLGLAKDGLEGFVGGLAATAMQFIAMMLAKSIAAAIFTAEQMAVLTGPAGIFSAPALIATAIGGVMSAFAAIPAFAAGGIVSGPTLGLMGEYPGASTNPEVIAPLSKLKAMMGGGGGQTVILQPSIEMTGDRFRIMLNRVEGNVRKRT